ncbi:spore germination protein [Phosphitispora sp. TUW77]|uniref:spore germination protein n=1 Tax=Phosphitispora sp. TUW77 TaxID=3152361 RepID=UPI003AB1BC51
MEKNIEILKEIFNNDDTIIYRKFRNQANNAIRCCIIFADGMVNNEIVNENILQPIAANKLLKPGKDIIDNLQYGVIIANDVKKTADVYKVVESIINGDTALLVENEKESLIINTKGWQSRSITEPETEKALRGPREGFTESLMINLTLIRRKLKTPDLKFNFRTIGVKSQTKACICYIDGIANKKILEEFNKRLDTIEIDGVLDTGYIEELISDAPHSMFRTIGSTERPDIVAGNMLEGRIALVLDGTPFVLTVPFLFMEFFQSNEDYYTNYYTASISRLLRNISFILTISVPAIYLALTTFHQEMIPTHLLMSISAARQDMPFPTIIEALGMLIVFEILREAGARMPSFIGQSLSIVGALVIGQAAVEARFISAPMIIVIAFSGITGLMISKMKGAIFMLRLIFLFLASFLGLYGFVFGITGLLILLFEMRSFGVPYMSNLASFNPQDLKDTVIRAPWWHMKYRPKFITARNKIRNASGGRKL